jgi:NADH-quinone oxidoreductase subunit M
MSYALSLLIGIPLLGAVAAYIAGKRDSRGAIYVTAGVSIFVLAIAVYTYAGIYANPPAPGGYSLVEKYAWINIGGFTINYFLGVDGLSAPLILVSAILTVLVIVGSKAEIHHHEPEYYALLLLFEGSIMGVFSSLNLVMFYIFWELVLIPMFFFIGIWGGERRKYAAMKFILFTFVASTIMLLGFLAVYLGVSPTTFDIPDLSGKVPAGIQFLPLIATFIGFGVKLPVVPFHTWLPDAHVEAPAPISVLLAGVLLKMGGYGFIRISIGLFPNASLQYAWAFMLIGIVSMFYGAIVALLAKDLKKIIAFTSINHMGFVLFGAYATVVSGNILGVQGAIFQMFTHALAIGSLFMLSGYIKELAGTRDITVLRGLKTTMPRVSVLLVLGSAAAMGMPPFASFLAELMVIAAGISAYPVTAITILVPVITSGYFLWMIKRTVLSSAGDRANVHDLHGLDLFALSLYYVPLIILIVFSSLILDPATPVAQWVVHLRGP